MSDIVFASENQLQGKPDCRQAGVKAIFLSFPLKFYFLSFLSPRSYFYNSPLKSFGDYSKLAILPSFGPCILQDIHTLPAMSGTPGPSDIL